MIKHKKKYFIFNLKKMLKRKIFGQKPAQQHVENQVNTATSQSKSSQKPFEVSIDDIKSKFVLSDYVSRHVKLKKTGSNSFTGVCPFHEDKSPSLSINDEKGVFICGGCKKAGNVVHFHSFINEISMRESFIHFAQQITGKNISGSKAHLNEVNNLFVQNISKSNSAQEFLNSRLIKPEAIKDFEIGFCMGKEHEFLSPGNLEAAKKAGLVSEKNWMSFTRRVIFPIRNFNGALIGFGGRAIDENQKIKYLNSAESEDFKKGMNLYAGNLLRLKKGDPIVVVEGFFDVIACHQNGAKNVVGSMGTSISKEMIEELFKRTDHIVFCLDPDNAGRIGTLKNIDIAAQVLSEGKRISFVTLPENMDPDEFIGKNGIDAFKEHVRLSESIADYLCRVTEERYDLSSMDERSQYRQEMKLNAEKFVNCPSIQEEIEVSSKLRTLSSAYRNIVVADHSNMSQDEIEIIKEQIDSISNLINRKREFN